ncbi:hypothetical protein HKBW3S03_01202, partial [Candidatus Hakubella thermalkaliphila]
RIEKNPKAVENSERLVDRLLEGWADG